MCGLCRGGRIRSTPTKAASSPSPIPAASSRGRLKAWVGVRFGRLDILVHNAGVPIGSPAENVREYYDRMLGQLWSLTTAPYAGQVA